MCAYRMRELRIFRRQCCGVGGCCHVLWVEIQMAFSGRFAVSALLRRCYTC